MHSSRMHTAHLLAISPSMDCSGGSVLVHAGIHPPGCGPGDPPECGPGDTLRCGPGNAPRCWPRHPLARPLNLPSVWAWRHPPLETCKACWDTTPPRDLQGMLGYHLQGMLGYYPPPSEQNDRQVQKYYLAPNFVCGR